MPNDEIKHGTTETKTTTEHPAPKPTPAEVTKETTETTKTTEKTGGDAAVTTKHDTKNF